jgi:glycosyltransferase involved in cell wall biosynthesis
MTMRVALIDPSLFTLPYDVALADGLRANGHQVTLHGRPPTSRESAAAVTPSFYRLSAALPALPGPLRLAVKGIDHGVSLLRLRRRLAAERPDIIHFQWLPLPALDRVLLGQFRKIAPVILTVHDTNAFNGDPTARLQAIGFASALSACDRLVVHTSQGEARLRAMGISATKIATLPHGLLGARSGAGEDLAGDLRFVLFGKIKPYKGADLLIEAFAALPDAVRARARVLVVGQAYMKLQALRDLAAARGVADRVAIEDRFVGEAEIADLFAPGSVAVFPYREIEASGVLSLAIAHARPIIASRLGMFAEALTDGVHGRLVAPGDIAALTAAMAGMIEDRDFTLAAGRAVARLARDVPDWVEIGRRTARLYATCRAARLPDQGAGPAEWAKDAA